MPALLWLLGGAAACGLGTAWLGWWSVPVVALALGRAVPSRFRPLLLVPVAAGLGWGALLLRAGLRPSFGRLEARLAALLPVSSGGLVAATLIFPALVALGATLIARTGRRPTS